MVSKYIRALTVLLCMVLLLPGCQQKEDPGITETQFWTVWPQLESGVMEYEKLEVRPWYSGRCEAVVNYQMAETETGYYMHFEESLYYADKADLSTWVRVCNRPDCNHGDPVKCNARLIDGAFVISGDRIYFGSDLSLHQELYHNTNVMGPALFSRALDGSDLRLECADEELLSNDGGGSYRWFLSAEHWLQNVVKLNKDGTYTLQLYRTTRDGREKLVDETIESDDFPMSFMMYRTHSVIRGEPSFDHMLLGDRPYMECRYKDGKLYFTDLTGYYDFNGYLAGNVLRIFRENDGYYDVNLTTREECKVADAQLQGSSANVLLPNCIIESTLFYASHDKFAEDSQHRMLLFDGESWREVQLPQELLNVKKGNYLITKSVTSDSVFFVRKDMMQAFLYRIPITNGELRLEYCGRIK